MPIDDPSFPHRRRLLRQGAALFAFGAGLTVAAGSAAASKVSKEFVKYQYSPKDSARCGVCASFIPPAGGSANEAGSCKIVEGAILQNGWCQVFSRPATLGR